MANSEKELEVSEGCIGNFTFTVTLAGMGKTAQEAWDDCCESVGMDGLGCIPDLPDISLDDEEEV